MKCPNCGHLISEPRNKDQSRMLHKLIRDYAHEVGYDYEFAKAELKYRYGEWVPVPLDLTDWEPPAWAGAFFEMYPGTVHHTIVFMKSESEYTKEEERRLIDGTVSRCLEVGADIAWYYEYQEQQIADQNESKKEEVRLSKSKGGALESV